MVLFILSALIVGILCWLILLELCKCIKIKDTYKIDKSKVINIPTKADIEQYNNQICQQNIINDQKAKRHIIDILDIAYKDYVNKQIENNRYIAWFFTLSIGDYGITADEILTIRDNPFSHGIYKVEYQRGMYRVPYCLVVTVNN